MIRNDSNRGTWILLSLHWTTLYSVVIVVIHLFLCRSIPNLHRYVFQFNCVVLLEPYLSIIISSHTMHTSMCMSSRRFAGPSHFTFIQLSHNNAHQNIDCT